MDSPLSLTEVFATLPDPRDPRGKQYPLPALLNLLAVAMLAGMRSLEAVAQFGREHGQPLAHALGFRSRKTPCKAALSNFLRRLDVHTFERALAGWVRARCPDLGDTLAIDGKTLRGSATYQLPGVHLLAAYAPRVAAVVAQVHVARKTNEHKAALELLGVLPLAGKVVTGDAMFCHHDVCEKVLQKGGDYLWTVKDNQPQLHYDIACLFAESSAFSPYQQQRLQAELDSVTTCNKGHGRVEKRTLTATPVLREYLEWPGVQQVFQLQRVRKLADKEERETCYGITSLSRQQADAARLLELVRGHWGIENNLHGERDGVFGEDGWRVRSGEGPQVLAATRNALLMLLEERQTANKAAAMRRFVIRPLEAFDLIASKPEH